jgi:hypothetical protein
VSPAAKLYCYPTIPAVYVCPGSWYTLPRWTVLPELRVPLKNVGLKGASTAVDDTVRGTVCHAR